MGLDSACLSFTSPPRLVLDTSQDFSDLCKPNGAAIRFLECVGIENLMFSVARLGKSNYASNSEGVKLSVAARLTFLPLLWGHETQLTNPKET